MTLYKYLSSDRIDVLKNREIRYTQFGDLNDPFELNPNINNIATKDEVDKLLQRDLPSLIAQEYEKYPIVHALISKEDFVKLAQSQEDVFPQMYSQLEPVFIKYVKELLQYQFNQHVGILSLSEDPLNKIMWSRYADDNKGYVIGFNADHPWFNQKKGLNDELRHLRKVVYSEKRPEINLMNTNGVEIFLNKSLDSQQEREWRIIRPLSEAAEIIDKQPFPIYLFSFPPNAITDLIYGCRMSESNIDLISQLIDNNTENAHIKLFQSHLDETNYSIYIKQLA